MRALIITPAVIRQAAELAAWADRPENRYRPTEAGVPAGVPPADNPAYVLHLERGFRAVYSQTLIGGTRYRHLSISVASAEKFPHPYCAWTIASWFGFTGGQAERGAVTVPGPDWQMDTNRQERCFTMAQEIPEGTPCAP